MYCPRLVCTARTIPLVFIMQPLTSNSSDVHTAPSHNLNGDGYIHHTCKHTEVLVEELELGVLWNKYDLVGNLVVSKIIFFVISLCCVFVYWALFFFTAQPFQNGCGSPFLDSPHTPSALPISQCALCHG
jgi:hypothetical protein